MVGGRETVGVEMIVGRKDEEENGEEAEGCGEEWEVEEVSDGERRRVDSG